MVGTVSQKPSQFASPERAELVQVEQDSTYFERYPMLVEVLNGVPDVLMVVNKHRQIIFANYLVLERIGIRAARSIIGMRPGEVVNCIHAKNDTGGCGTSKACSTCGAIKAILLSMKGKSNQQECRIMQADGGALDFSVSASPINVGDERFSVVTLHDISHEKRRRALERIFFHDLLNSASVLHGFLDLLDEVDDPTQRQEYVKHMRDSAKRLVGEINAQKQLSAAENNELQPKFMVLDSVTLLREVMLQYARQELAQDRRIEVATHSQPVAFLSDYTLLGRVLGNLVKNALEASNPGDTVTLYCGTSTDGGVEFSVNNPQVMPERVKLQVFQRSFSTKGQGRGLGTYSVKLLTERYLHGKASFTSEEDSGTTFTVSYPIDPND